MKYKRGATNMIPDGEHDAVISDVREHEESLIVEFSLEDGTLFATFIKPRFSVFDDLLKIAGVSLDKAEGDFDEQKLKDKLVKIVTKITVKDENEYCNVTSVTELENPKETEGKDEKEEEPKGDDAFPDEGKKD